MNSTKIHKGISDTDLQIIADLVALHPDEIIPFFYRKLNYIFGKEISVNHYIALGYEIGHRDGTEKTLSEINHNFQLCQRAN